MHCAACGSSNLTAVGLVPSYVEGAAIAVYQCDFCGSQLAAADEATEEIYDAIYAHGDRLLGYHRYFRYARYIQQWKRPLSALARSEACYEGVRRVIRDRMSDNRSARVLEVGSGLGYLTAALRREGIAARGIDVSGRAVADSVSRFGPYYSSARAEDLLGDDTVGKFDVIIALELIEHLADPRLFLEGLAGLLADEGAIILSTPNRSSAPHGAVWMTDLPPVHLHWFTSSGIAALSAASGLTVSFADFSSYNRAIVPLLRRTIAGTSRTEVLDKHLQPSAISLPSARERAAYRTSMVPYVLWAFRKLTPSCDETLVAILSKQCP